MGKLLEVKNLKVQFETSDGIVKALNGIDISLDEGMTLGLVGETGAGKTTLAKSIMRIVPQPPGKIVSGEILYDGNDILKMDKNEIRKIRGQHISMIFQDPMTSLNPVMTVGDQIAETIKTHEKISAVEATKKACEMLELVGIKADRAGDYPHQFSGGMKQRVVIAIALACNPKILIADDQELIRESLKIILSTNNEFEVIDTVGSGKEVVESIRRHIPDIILMDVRMPDMDGVQCTKFVKEVYPEIKVIVLTTFDDDEYIFSALKYGASGYLLKGVSLDELTSAIKTVLQGGAIFNPNVASKVTKIFSEMAKNNIVAERIHDEDLPNLSDTEWKIIQQVSQGLSNKEIAEILKFTEGTIRNYLSVILDKLQLRDRTQLAIWYIHRGKEA